MSTAIQWAALPCTVLGLLSAAAALAATRDARLSVKVLLEFLLAAGLLRLVGDPSPQAIASAAAVIAIRQLLAFGLRQTSPEPVAGSPG